MGYVKNTASNAENKDERTINWSGITIIERTLARWAGKEKAQGERRNL
jgi:hypothetical protein